MYLITAVDSSTQCKIDTLKGKGNTYYKNCWLYIQWDAGGGGLAPQNELKPISNYVSVDGTFTHTAFSTGLAIGDKVLVLHESEFIESLIFNPGIPDTGDLEGGTKTIVAVAEGAGIGAADYNAVLTLPAPTDAKIIIIRIAERLAVTINSMTAGHLYCRVYVDAQDAAHRLFDMDWATTGAKLTAGDFSAGTAFNLLKDGAAHTFYFFFWVDAGNAVISLVRLQEVVGTCNHAGNGYEVLTVEHEGLMYVMGDCRVEGTGNFSVILHRGLGVSAPNLGGSTFYESAESAALKYLRAAGMVMGDGNLTVRMARGTVTTDIAYICYFGVVLRREV